MFKLSYWINRILFPKRCGFCDSYIPEEAPLHVCDACLEKLPVTRGNGKQILKGHIDFVLSPFCYQKPIRNIIRKMKFRDKPMLAHTIGAFMAERLVAVCDLSQIDLVVPVPMTRRKLSQRGYNPAALLASEIATRCELAIDEYALRKIRETVPQSRLRSTQERMLNVRDVFECKADLEDLNILLVDDVYTSGHTLKNCAKALKVAGAGRIVALTAAQAHALPAKNKVCYRRIKNMVFRMK